MLKTGRMSRASSTSPTPAAVQRRPCTSRAHDVQAREALLSCRIRGQSTRGPTLPEHRQQGEHDRGADQRDEHPADAHAAQERDGHDDQRDERDGDRAGARHHGVPGGAHRLHDGGGVVTAVLALLAPTVHHQQRVVDRQAQADQRDEELHDEADVGDVADGEHAQERGQDGDRGD